MRRKISLALLAIIIIIGLSSCQPWNRWGWIDLPDWLSGTYVGHPNDGNIVPFSYAVVGFYDDNNISFIINDVNGTGMQLSSSIAEILMDDEGVRDASQSAIDELKSYTVYIYNNDGTTDIININGLTEPITLKWQRKENGVAITYFDMWLEKDPLGWEGGVQER